MSSHSLYYILNAAGEPVPTDLLTWSVWFERANRQIAQTTIGDVDVSTVFLGLDYGHGYGLTSSVLWETMVFGGPLDRTVRRYETRVQAIAGHEQMVARVRDEQAE